MNRLTKSGEQSNIIPCAAHESSAAGEARGTLRTGYCRSNSEEEIGVRKRSQSDITFESRPVTPPRAGGDSRRETNKEKPIRLSSD